MKDEGGASPPQPRGVTPTTIERLSPGKYTVHLELPGYRYFQKDVEVKENATIKVRATLRRE
jgi:HSP20 family molecular chaperone IbpA